MRALLLVVVCALSSVACTRSPAQVSTNWSLVPIPVSVEAAEGTWFTLSGSTHIRTPPGSGEAAAVGGYLAGVLRRSTGYPLPLSDAAAAPPGGSISLEQVRDDRLGDEGYRLEVTAEAATLRANRPAGLFMGVQTLRQLLPAAIERVTPQPGPWRIPGVRIVDHPRFAWRGAALDVARHFFTVDEVKRYVDLIALYKLNVLHLHLTDDQGWRIAVRSWPRLATHGGGTEVGGGPGGHYTQEQYAEIVAYARDRHVTIVPEVDVPGHTNAALASYAELNCDGHAPERYTGTEVGFSSLCVEEPVTYRFLDQVLGELAALTPGPYLHIGGDEVKTLGDEQYAAFVERVQRIVQAHGKRAIGWQEITKARLLPTTVAQYWDHRAAGDAVRATRQGTKLVLSPAPMTYLDMKYDEGTRLGLDWAGHVEVRDAYEWDPATLLDGVGADDVLGVETQLWSETLRSVEDVELMTFPRLPAVAEVGWSPAAARRWDDHRRRLAAQGPRWSAMAVRYHRSPQVPWPD
jgi:hexosaminidase